MKKGIVLGIIISALVLATILSVYFTNFGGQQMVGATPALRITQGGTGTTTSPNNGQVLVGNSSGFYDYVATSTFGGGTVTSVDMSVPTGLTIAGNPITTGGTLALTLTNGYVITTSTREALQDTAYSWGDWSGEGFITAADVPANETDAAHDTCAEVTGCVQNALINGSIDTIAELNAILTGEDVASTTYFTAGDALTLTGNDFDFDGGASPGGALGGTWASPTVDSDGTWTGHNSYPSGCSAGQFVTTIGDTLTCDTPVGGGGESIWATSSATQLYVTGYNVGIGTSTPTEQLVIASSTGNASILLSPMDNFITPKSTTTQNDLLIEANGQGYFTIAATNYQNRASTTPLIQMRMPRDYDFKDNGWALDSSYSSSIILGGNAGLNYDLSLGSPGGGVILIGNDAGREMLASSTPWYGNYVSIAIGDDALSHISCPGTYGICGENIAIGRAALFAMYDGVGNIAIGVDAAMGLDSGENNIVIGRDSGLDLTDADNNVILGTYSAGSYDGSDFSSGGVSDNVFIGNGVFNNASLSGVENSILGNHALSYVGPNSSKNVIMGHEAGKFGTSSNNVMLGYQSGYGGGWNGTDYDFICKTTDISECGQHTGNTFLGYQSGNFIKEGDYNILLGYKSGYNIQDNSNNIIIGNNINLPASTTQSDTLDIANLIYGTGLTEFGSPSNLISEGNIGIGTSTPNSKLVVSGNTELTGFLVQPGINNSLAFYSNAVDSIETETTQLADSYTEDNYESSYFGIYNDHYAGQSFTAVSGEIIRVILYLGRTATGVLSGTSTVKIYDITGTYGTNNTPTGTPLAISDEFDVSELTTSPGLKSFEFSGENQITLVAESYYAIVLEYQGGSLFYQIVMTGDDSGTHDGNGFYTEDGSTWSASAQDQIFYVYEKAIQNLDASNFTHITSTSTMVISSTGYLGVGTATPAYILDTYGNSRIDGTLTLGTYTLPATDGTTGQVLKTDGNGTLTWSDDDNSGGGGESIWATTTYGVQPNIIYPIATTSTLLIGTSTIRDDGSIMEVTGKSSFRNSATFFSYQDRACTSGYSSNIVLANLDTGSSMYLEGYETSNYIGSRRANGSWTTPTATLLDNTLLDIYAGGHSGVGWLINKAGITMKASENWGTASSGTYILFNTTPNGSLTYAERLRIDQSGYVGIATSTPAYTLDVYGNFAVGQTSQFTVNTFGQASSTALTVSGNTWLTGLATAAGAFLAVDPTGKVIATTTPTGSDSDWTQHDSYPAACSAGQFATQIGDNLTCAAPNVSSDGVWTVTTNAIYNSTSTDTVVIGTSTLVRDDGKELIVEGQALINGQTVLSSTGHTGSGFSNTLVLAEKNIGASLNLIGFDDSNVINSRRSNGTADTPQATALDNVLLGLYAGGNSGVGALDYKAKISMNASENWGTASSGTYIAFSTTPNNSVTIAERLRIDQSGYVGIGDTSPLQLLTVGSGDVFTVNTLGQASTTALTVSGTTYLNNATVSGTLTVENGVFTGDFEFDGTVDFTNAVVTEEMYPSFTIASSTWNSISSGTSTIPLGFGFSGETWISVGCSVDTGSLKFQFGDGTNKMTMFSATTSNPVTINTVAANNTFTTGEKRYVDVGTIASSPNFLTCSVKKRIND